MTLMEQLPSLAKIMDSLPAELAAQIAKYLEGPVPERVRRLNLLREYVSGFSPFSGEPVDFVEWVPADTVHANDYNPNTVAPPEMELLRLSIMADGYTQPIVTMPDGENREVIDGFHRHRVGKEAPDVAARIHGYLPVVRIRQDREGRNDRIAATIRHNRARGKHRIDAMSEIVIELKRRNWTDERIGRELGMDPDEVLRLCQISGLAELFSDEEFSASWDVIDPQDETEEFSDTPDGEPADADEDATDQGMPRVYHTWDRWEAFAAGFFDNAPSNRSLTEGACKAMFADFLRDIPRFQAAMDGVFRDWPNSTEHNLTNERMNRIAWLGQAAMCWETGIPASFCNGFSLLTDAEQEAANLAALAHLNKWLESRGYPTLATLKAAERKTQPELY